MSCVYGIEQSCDECRMCQDKEEEQARTELNNNNTSNKAILVIDIPENCLKCPMLNGADECILQDEDANFLADTFNQLREGCPLKELPEKMEVCGKYPQEDGIAPSYKIGWNDCIDTILKECE